LIRFDVVIIGGGLSGSSTALNLSKKGYSVLIIEKEKFQVSRWGTIKADFDTMETSIEGVFAAGDIVRGASLVVWGIKDGRDAATSIDNYLQSKQKLRVA